jgi:hypothetical protein
MNTLLVVLFFLVMFSMFVCLENSSQLLEGFNSTSEGLLQEARLSASQGVCTDSSGTPVWPRDEESCTGMSGFQLNFIPPPEKRVLLTEINTPDEVISRELSLEYGDVVGIDGETDLFIYRGIDEINLEQHPDSEYIAMFPYVNPSTDKIEYCYDDDNTLVDADIPGTCTSEHQGTFFRPVLEPNLDLTAVSDDLKSDSCQDNGDGSYFTSGGIPCFTKDKIKISNCVELDGSSAVNIKPVSFWKSRYALGSNKRINELCEGTRSGNTWNYNNNLNTMMDSQIFAEYVSSQVDRNVQELNEGASLDFTTSQGNNYILPTQQAALQLQQESARSTYLSTGCGFEGDNEPTPRRYHGNTASNTANLYVCGGALDIDSVTSISDNCQPSQLSCNPNFAKDHSSGLAKRIQCANGTFTYIGCEPDTCSLPPDFSDKYEIMNNAIVGDTVTINDLKDMVTDTLNVRCKNGYNGTPIITSCNSSGNGVLAISGCEENTCVLPTDASSYNIQQQPSSQGETLTTLYTNNGMDQPYQTDGPSGFGCNGPNYYHLPNVTDTGFGDFMNDVNESKNLEDHTFYPKAVCNTDQNESPPYEFLLSGCQPNQCHNPSVSQKIYDGDQKPEYIGDTVDIKIRGNERYVKYEYDGNVSSTSNTIPFSEIQNNISCGRNYQKEGVIGSTDTDDKVIDNDKVICYNFYDYNNLTDTSNNGSPKYRKKLQDDTFSPEPTDLNDFHSVWLSNYPDTERVLPLSVSGCLENYCTWPTISGDQPSYDRPMRRDPTKSGIDEGVLSSMQNSNGRYQLGYQYESNNPEDKSIDYTTRKTAREYVGYEESDNSVKITCVGQNDQVCEEEPPYQIDEIDEMITSISPEILKKGQNDTLLTTTELSNMGRGGNFTTRRCWNSTSTPDVTCQGSVDCSDSNSSTCEASVSGCFQNKCTINSSDALGGTRVLIEKIDDLGQPIFLSVGGTDLENIGESFNVDQIRNITCDFNHSKPTIGGTPENPYGGGSGIEDIVIECQSNDTNFTIINKCGATVCGNTIDSIDELINLTNHNGDVNTVCPNQSFIDSHDTFYTGTNSTPSTNSLSNISDYDTITTKEYCRNDAFSNQSLFDFNASRYKLNGNDYTCYNQDTLPDNLQNGLSSVGSVRDSCNYAPNTFENPKRSVRGCQPKLCILPPQSPGYIYNTDLLTPNEYYSTDSILKRDYYEGINGERPSYLVESEYNKLTFDQDLITCGNGYTGSVEISCSQTESEHRSGEYNTMNISGCSLNQCTLPTSLVSGITLSDTLSQSGTYSVPELLAGMSCSNHHSVNPNYEISCETQDGVFTGMETYCSANTCTIPPIINVSDETNSKYTNRLRVLDSGTVDINSIPDSELPASLIISDGLGDTERVSREELRGEIYNYVKPPINHQMCYENLPNSGTSSSVSDLSSVTCNSVICSGSPILTCGTEEGVNTDLQVSGCEEKYCILPTLSSNTMLYNFGGVREKLELVSSINRGSQSTTPGLTKDQVEQVFNHGNVTLGCASFAERDVEENPTGDTPEQLIPTIECRNNGDEFLLTGCRHLQQLEQNHTTGDIIYSYYPSGCPIIKENAFVYLSGTDLFGRGENTSGQSVTHSLDRNNPVIEPNENTEYYYYKNKAESSEDEPIHAYSSDPPILSDGSVWSQDNEADVNENWYKVPMVINYTGLSQSQINTKMKSFMDVNKDMCDKISSCEGFNITRFNRLTSEIDAIEKADARVIDDTDDSLSIGSVRTEVLATFLSDPTNDFLEYGTMKGEQTDTRCNSHMDVTVVGFHDDWGGTTGEGGNSYVYNSTTVNGLSQDVLNHNIVPHNSSIYFKKNTLTTPVDNPLMGFTSNDIPDTVVEPSR